MAVEVVVLALAVLGIGAATALTFWGQILHWSMENLVTWLETRQPHLADYARLSMVKLDGLAVAARNAVKEIWQNLRRSLLKQIVTIERQSTNSWIRKTTTWLITTLESGQPQTVRRITEEDVNWDQLPPEVREASLRRNENESTLDVTEIRDRELETITLTN